MVRAVRVLRPRIAAVAVLSLGVLASACTSSSSSGGSSGTAAPGTGPSQVATGGCNAGVVTDEPLLAATSDAPVDASYANTPTAPQAKDCDGMRTFLATPAPGFDLQSYVFYGYLRDKAGKVIPFSNLNQQSGVAIGNAPKTRVLTAGVTANLGQGMFFGGVTGTPDQSAAVSLTSNPFSMRSQAFTAGSAPQYVDARVIEGQLGQPGAILMITAQMDAVDADGKMAPTQVSVRVKDVAGVGQWGFGPAGFFPQWILPEQREAITKEHGGSVERYLQATNDPMTNQGSYYYSSPVAQVQEFTVTQNGQVVSEGTDGELLLDYVTQTFDAKALAIVGAGVQWTEFSVLLDGGKTMKIGEVEQSSVGTYPYAVLLSTDGSRGANGSLMASRRWNIDAIELAPDTTKTWTSPRSKSVYPTVYTATLADPDPSKATKLTFTALYDDQEISIGGRDVYEGIYKVTGTLDGQPTSGYAWAEIQPSGKL